MYNTHQSVLYATVIYDIVVQKLMKQGRLKTDLSGSLTSSLYAV